MPGQAQTRSIDTSIVINAPPEAVWSALTTAEGLTGWFPLQARVTPGVGGKIWSSWGGDFEGECRIDVWEPARRLRVVYPQFSPTAEIESGKAHDPWAGPLVATEYIIESRAGATTLRLVHSGFGAEAMWDDLYDGTKRGWSFELRGLRYYLERHPGQRRSVVRARASFDFPLEDAWSRLLSPRGMLREGRLEGLKEGEPFRITTATGDALTGRAQIVIAPNQMALEVDNWGGALVRAHFDEWKFPTLRRDAHMWISLYDAPAERVREIEDRWKPWFERLLAPGGPKGA